MRRGEHPEKSFSTAVVDDLKRDFETWKEKQFDQKEKQSSFSMSCVPILRSDAKKPKFALLLDANLGSILLQFVLLLFAYTTPDWYASIPAKIGVMSLLLGSSFL